MKKTNAPDKEGGAGGGAGEGGKGKNSGEQPESKKSGINAPDTSILARYPNIITAGSACCKSNTISDVINGTTCTCPLR